MNPRQILLFTALLFSHFVRTASFHVSFSARYRVDRRLAVTCRSSILDSPTETLDKSAVYHKLLGWMSQKGAILSGNIETRGTHLLHLPQFLQQMRI